MPLMGDTIKLKAEFKDFPDSEGESHYIDPTDIKLKIFDDSKRQIGDTVVIGAENRQAMGIYECFYTIPSIESTLLNKSDCKLYPEFSGLDILSNPIIARCEINRKWKK